MLAKIYSWLKKIKPRYLLSIDDKIFNEKTKLNDYRFKSFGEHNFPVFNYNDIIKNKHILYSINPSELVCIAIDNHINEEKRSMFAISEYLRGNKYRLCNEYFNKVLSGEEICSSPALLEKISQLNVYKIAYNTGFIDGRVFSKQLVTDLESGREKPTITKLTIVSKNN
jgi:putative cell wall-binding protein